MKIDSIKNFYGDDSNLYDDRWRKKGGEYTNNTQLEIVKGLTAEWRNKKVLEIGCGTGRFSVGLAKSNPELMLMDLTNEMLEITLQKVGRTHEGINASVYEIPLPSNSVEAILSINVFNHIENIESALREVNRILKDGGELVINFTNIASYFFIAALLVNFRKESIGRRVYSRWISRNKFIRMLKNNGFEITGQVGNVFVPIYLDKPLIRDVLIFLDKISARSIFRDLSPSIFLKCKKVKNTSNGQKEGMPDIKSA